MKHTGNTVYTCDAPECPRPTVKMSEPPYLLLPPTDEGWDEWTLASGVREHMPADCKHACSSACGIRMLDRSGGPIAKEKPTKEIKEPAKEPAEDNYVAWLRYDVKPKVGPVVKVCDSSAEKAFKVYRHPAWVENIEAIRRNHNGVFSVELFLGHDGHNLCQFRNYQEMIASGESGNSMAEAVTRCIKDWQAKKCTPKSS